MERTICRDLWRFALVCLLVLFALPWVAAGSAQLVVQAAERERWYGEDNLGGEVYGKRIAMDGDYMVTAGEFKAVVWWYSGASWIPTQVLDPQIGRIEDVAISIATSPGSAPHSIVLAAPSALYGQKWPMGGQVAVYHHGLVAGGWVLHATFGAPDLTPDGYEVHNFASSVDVGADGLTLLVGAPDSRTLPPLPTDGPGFVFIYTWDGANWLWVGDMKDESHPWRFFGASLDFEGGWLIVGAPRDPDFAGANEYGAAFVFEGSGTSWNEVCHVDPSLSDPPDPFDDNNFARFVANDNGLYMAVAADGGVKFLTLTAEDDCIEQWLPLPTVPPLPPRTVSRVTQGMDLDFQTALYVDRTSGEVVELERISGQWHDQGPLPGGLATEPWGVAVDQRRAAVGYPLEDTAGPNTGRIVTYDTNNTSAPTGVLVYGEPSDYDLFGSAVDGAPTGVEGATAIVGAPRDRDMGPNGPVGAAYFYEYDGVADQWTKSERWQPAGLSANAGFGAAVVYNAPLAYAAAAPWNRVDGAIVGSVFVRHSGSGILQLNGSTAVEGFGQSIAYRGDHLLVGAPYHGGTGGVYPYRYDPTNAWELLGPPLSPPGLTASAGAGTAVATDGQWLVIGAPGDDWDGQDAGAAVVYELVGAAWIPHGRLDPGLLSSWDSFGASVAVEGGFAFVGAPGASGVGAVHLFQWDGGAWQWVDKLTAGGAQAGDAFGSSLEVEGYDLFVGAPGDDDDRGATYPYRRAGDTWTAATSRIVHSNPAAEDVASKSLAFVNDMLLVGAPGESSAALGGGAVIVFDYSVRVEVPSPLAPGQPPCSGDFEFDFSQRFVPPVSQSTNRNFGNIVDLSGDAMIVSEPSAQFDFIDAGGQPKSVTVGAVHIYRRTSVGQWTREKTLFPPLEDVDPGVLVSLFGIAAAIDDDLLVIGNWYTNWVYVYERTGSVWELRTRLLTANPGWGFGAHGLDISGSTIMVGENGYPALGLTGAGQVYFYERSGETTWVLNAGPLPSLDAEHGQHFGYRVAIDAVTGRAVATGDGGAHPHTAYLFERVGGVWQDTGRLEGDPHGASNYFGRALGIDGATIVVGDHLHNGVNGPGAAFVWEHDGAAWTGPDLLVKGSVGYSDSAGESVAIDGDLIVVGASSAYTEFPFGARTGAAYVYGRQGGVWSERLRILPDDLSLVRYGTATAVSAGIVAAGTLNQGAGPREGTAYAYDVVCLPEAPGWAQQAAALCALGALARRRRRAGT